MVMSAKTSILPALIALAYGIDAYAADEACSGPGYMVAIDTAVALPTPPKGRGRWMLRSPAVRVYEGEPWRSFALTRWSCVEEAVKALPKGSKPGSSGLPAFTVFRESGAIPASSFESVPPGCTQRIYVAGTHEILDPTQYAIYSKALSAAGAGGFGMRLIFQGDTPLSQSQGSWPARMQLALTEWPCTAAWEGFFLGDNYRTKVLHLRDNAARYRMASYRPLDTK